MIIVYTNIFLPVVSCGRENSVSVSKGRALSNGVWNRVLRSVFGPKRDGITEGRQNCIAKDVRSSALLTRVIRLIQ
jgi:hypothetical protein